MTSHSSESKNSSAENVTCAEIRHVPLSVKGIVAGGIILFLIQMPSFMSSLTDAIHKNQASIAYENGQYAQAIDLYKGLLTRYPTDQGLIKKLGFSQYRKKQYLEALMTFDRLAGIKLPKKEVGEINAAIADISTKLNLTSQ